MPRKRAVSHSSKASSPPVEPSTFSDGLPLPKLFVFDLDYTLWAFWVDTHVTPPIKALEGGREVKDKWGEQYGFYNDVPDILVALRKKDIKVGAASRTHAPELGREMLRLLRISEGDNPSEKALDFFDHLQIYPGSKITHFKRLHEQTDLPYDEMLFFDDESRNRDVESLGVIMHLVRDGVTREEVDKGVRSWRKRTGRGKATEVEGT